jgi:para-nitrobenzyl esterase
LKDGPDYLNLNVFTPDIGASKLPVLVWIHGGAFVTGTSASPWYEATSLAAAGIVLVTINYRLGYEGLLPIAGCPSNRSVRDWLAALAWVQECIGAFGGNPHNVTIGGQSAGSEACLTLLTLPKARGLFRRAIAMSGALLPPNEISDAGAMAQRVATLLKVSPDRDGLGALPPEVLLGAQPKTIGLGGGGGQKGSFVDRLGEKNDYIRPYVDGDLIPNLPFDAVAAGAGSDVELLLGCTSEEANAVARILSRWIGDAKLRKGLGNLGLGAVQIETYISALKAGHRREVLGQAITDQGFRAPVSRLAELRGATSGSTYCYEFKWKTPRYFGLLGAVHCVDIPFAFNSLETAQKGIVGKSAPASLASKVHTAWTDFITSGNPGWSRYGAPTREVMMFDSQSRVEHDPLALVRSLWP